jgi:hypothetical protein
VARRFAQHVERLVIGEFSVKEHCEEINGDDGGTSGGKRGRRKTSFGEQKENVSW